MTHTYTKELKTKTQIKEETVIQESIYTTDFYILWDEKALGVFITTFDSDDKIMKGRIALVLGAEGSGLRRLVSETCDRLVKIPISNNVESLNLSNAAAVALYSFAQSNRAK